MNLAKDIVVTQAAVQMADDYCAYAASVNLGRAIPSVLDGLKPVQRRILYAMHEMGLDWDKPFKKSARIEGEVMGKYHPHSGQYSAVVNLANSWANRYALIDGQGNWGTVSDGPASARYTEARLNQFSQDVMLSLLDSSWSEFRPNYDDSLQEPVSLPARLPMLLLRDTAGIGVAAACRHVSYNLRQVAQLSIAALTTTGLGLRLQPDKALSFVTQPDFAMGGQVLADDGMRNAIVTGQGTLRVYAKTEFDSDLCQIVATELPQDVSPEQVLNQTFAMLKSDKLDRKTLADARDESDRFGTRVVWELTKKAWAKGMQHWLLAELYKHTDLQITVSVNAVSVDSTGLSYSCKGAADVASDWAEHRRSTELARQSYLLDKYSARSNLLDGLLIALDNIKVVAEVLIAGTSLLSLGLGLTELQVQAIEAMPLRSLKASHRQKLKDELAQLKASSLLATELLSDSAAMTRYLCNDVRAVAKQYGDPLRTTLYQEPAGLSESLARLEAERAAELASKPYGYLVDCQPEGKPHTYYMASSRNRKLPCTDVAKDSQLGIAAVLSDGFLYWLPATAMAVNRSTADVIKVLLADYGKPIAPGTVVLWSKVLDKSKLPSLSLQLTVAGPRGKGIRQIGVDAKQALEQVTPRKKRVWVGVATECTA